MIKIIQIFIALNLGCLGLLFAGDSSINSSNAKGEMATVAESNENTDVQIIAARARPADHDSSSAVYLTIKNNTDKTLNLIGASSLGLAQNIELHQTITDKNGVSTMQPVSKILIPAKAEVLLKPGHFHIMLMKLKKDLINNEPFDLNLAFEELETPRVVKVLVTNDM